MRKTTNKGILGLGLAVLLAPATTLAGGGSDFDEGMGAIVKQYEAIHAALAGDSTKGVRAAALRIGKLAGKLNAKAIRGPHAKHFADIPGDIEAAARKLAAARNLKAAREAFKALSRPLVRWATMAKPAGLKVVFCSMAKGSWLQRAKAVQNPYYGKKMLGCGEVISGGGEMAGHHGGMKHHDMKKGHHHGEKGHHHGKRGHHHGKKGHHHGGKGH